MVLGLADTYSERDLERFLLELRALARKGLREIAARGLKASGLRMDAVFYLLDAMRLFQRPGPQHAGEVRTLDYVNDPESSHFLCSLPAISSDARHMLCNSENLCRPIGELSGTGGTKRDKVPIDNCISVPLDNSVTDRMRRTGHNTSIVPQEMGQNN